jgi:hypothetical protein
MATMRKYAEFFTDFSVQESDLLNVPTQIVACSIIALTRKHLNCEVIWPWELSACTGLQFSRIKETYNIVEHKYA